MTKTRGSLTVLIMAGVLLGGAPQAFGAAKPGRLAFKALDVVAPQVLVTAMAIQPDGIIYAAGRYMMHDPDPYATPPLYPTGSVWLVSHGHGAPGSWTQQVSTTDSKAFPRFGVAHWTNHRLMPIDFTALGLTVDPHSPRVIYAAGCAAENTICDLPRGGPMVLRSTDSGQTWQSLLTLSNIVKSTALASALHFGSARPTQGYTIAIDPRTSNRLYAAVSGLGVLRSENGGRSWIYVTQPQSNNILKPCELLIDWQHPNTVYELAREGTVYRTTDSGQHWRVAAHLGAQTRSTLSSLTLFGRALYVTAAHGIYVSHDGGTHWQLAYPRPMPGDFDQSIRGANGWVSAFGPKLPRAIGGLYVLRDGGAWQPGADTQNHGPQGYGALDFDAMGGALDTRMWEDHTMRIIFTAAPLGGLYRWQSSV